MNRLKDIGSWIVAHKSEIAAAVATTGAVLSAVSTVVPAPAGAILAVVGTVCGLVAGRKYPAA